MPQNPNDAAYLDEQIAEVVNRLIQTSDPRLVVNALVGNASALCQLIVKAERATPAQVAEVFGTALVDALTPPAEEAPRIEVVPAGVIDLKSRR